MVNTFQLTRYVILTTSPYSTSYLKGFSFLNELKAAVRRWPFEDSSWLSRQPQQQPPSKFSSLNCKKKATTGASKEERLSSLEARDFDGCSRVVSGESKSRGQGRPRRSSTTRPRRPPRTSTDFCSYSQLLLSHHFLLIGRSLIATRIWVPIMTFGAKSCYVKCPFIMNWIPEVLPGKALKNYYNKKDIANCWSYLKCLHRKW